LIQFPNSHVLHPALGALNYVSLIASVFVQIMALIESLKDYSGKPKAMHTCALEVNALVQNLELDPRDSHEILRWYSQAYHRILKDADINHHDIDYRNWKLEEVRRREKKGLMDRLDLALWRVSYVWNVYALTTVILLSPGIVLWVLMSTGIQ
jgi:hypothetical protein